LKRFFLWTMTYIFRSSTRTKPISLLQQQEDADVCSASTPKGPRFQAKIDCFVTPNFRPFLEWLCELANRPLDLQWMGLIWLSPKRKRDECLYMGHEWSYPSFYIFFCVIHECHSYQMETTKKNTWDLMLSPSINPEVVILLWCILWVTARMRRIVSENHGEEDGISTWHICNLEHVLYLFILPDTSNICSPPSIDCVVGKCEILFPCLLKKPIP